MPASNDTVAKPEKLLYSVPEVMHVLSVSRQRVYDMIANGQLRRIKIGGSTRFRVSEVEMLVEKLAA